MEMIERDNLETQFKAFFPTLTEANWQQILDSKTKFEQNETPYRLRIENNRGYGASMQSNNL